MPQLALSCGGVHEPQPEGLLQHTLDAVKAALQLEVRPQRRLRLRRLRRARLAGPAAQGRP